MTDLTILQRAKLLAQLVDSLWLEQVEQTLPRPALVAHANAVVYHATVIRDAIETLPRAPELRDVTTTELYDLVLGQGRR